LVQPREALSGLEGIDLGNLDGGIMEDIQFDNLGIDGPESPIFVWLEDIEGLRARDIIAFGPRTIQTEIRRRNCES